MMPLTNQQIRSLCDQYGIKKYVIADGIVNVNGDVNLLDKELTYLPVQFGVVNGRFWCGSNQLTTLHGCPQTVHGGFYCFSNQLTSLDGGPKIVEGECLCMDNQLTTLDGCSEIIRGKLLCYNNQLSPDSYKAIINMDYLGSIDTDNKAFDAFINGWLEKISRDLAKASNKLHFSVALTRYLNSLPDEVV